MSQPHWSVLAQQAGTYSQFSRFIHREVEQLTTTMMRMMTKKWHDIKDERISECKSKEK